MGAGAVHAVTQAPPGAATLLTGLALVVLATVLALGARTLLNTLAVAERPFLPAADRPPAGLSRLIPVGPDVADEAETGLVRLDAWLRERRTGGGAPAP